MPPCLAEAAFSSKVAKASFLQFCIDPPKHFERIDSIVSSLVSSLSIRSSFRIRFRIHSDAVIPSFVDSVLMNSLSSTVIRSGILDVILFIFSTPCIANVFLIAICFILPHMTASSREKFGKNPKKVEKSGKHRKNKDEKIFLKNKNF